MKCWMCNKILPDNFYRNYCINCFKTNEEYKFAIHKRKTLEICIEVNCKELILYDQISCQFICKRHLEKLKEGKSIKSKSEEWYRNWENKEELFFKNRGNS